MDSRQRVQVLETALRNILETMPVHTPQHHLCVASMYELPDYPKFVSLHGYHVNYWPTTNRREIVDATGFDLDIIDRMADVLTFRIEPNKRRQGHGRQLYAAIESMCKSLGCTHIQTTPSGQGEAFWPKMGFNPIHNGIALKIL